MSATILDILPVARRLTLAGRRYRVPELRLRDVATLQAWLRSARPLVRPDPPPGVDADPAALARHHVRCWLASRRWPVAWGSPKADALLASAEGAGFFLWVALRRANRGFSRADALILAGTLGPGSWSRLHSALMGASPEIHDLSLFDPHSAAGGEGGDGADGPTTWEQAVVEVCLSLGQTPEAVGRLTLSQFHAIRAGGKPRARRLVPGPGQSLRDAAIARKRLIAEAVAEGEAMGGMAVGTMGAENEAATREGEDHGPGVERGEAGPGGEEEGGGETERPGDADR